MSAKILQINFKFSVPREVYEETVAPMASEFAAVPGCRWKVWLMNEAESEAGGVYLFDGDASLQAYLAGPLVAQVTSHPALSDFSVKQFEVLEEVSKITRGPIELAAAAESA
jgi:hypothetical protein